MKPGIGEPAVGKFGPMSTVMAANEFPEPAVPKAWTSSPFATEARVALPFALASRNSVLASVVNVSTVPSKVLIVIVVPETAVTCPLTDAGSISTVVAST
jgi:hypothetical protein